jgi:hypothetical protein
MTVLLTTIHDPEGRFLRIKNIENLVKGATSNYEKCIANVTAATHPNVRALSAEYFTCIISKTGTQGVHMIRLMKAASGRHFHYCDFDRIVHWQMRYPQELRRTAKKLDSSKGFTFICRTKRAFETHPDVQKDPERIMNAIISKYIGMKVDMGSGTFGFDNTAKRAFASIRGDVRDVRFLAQFLACMRRKKIPLSKIESEGMEWETPDVYKEEIRKKGYKRWLEEFQSHAEWKRRVGYIRQVVEVLSRK